MKKDNNKNIFSGLNIKKKKLSDKEREEMLSVFLENMTQSDLKSRTSNTRISYKPIHFFLAASIIGLICTLTWKYIPDKIILAPELKTVILSDNTTVILSPGAKLSYNPFFFHFTRQVALSGQACFNVQKKGHFSVISTLGIVNVLGTIFSVDTEPIFNTRCYKGKVEVLSTQTQRTISVDAGEEVNLVNGELLKKTIFESSPYWINNRFEFKNQPLKEVISIMSKQFHLQLRGIECTEGLDFTGSFPADNLSTACKLIFGPYDVSYKIREDTLYIETSH